MKRKILNQRLRLLSLAFLCACCAALPSPAFAQRNLTPVEARPSAGSVFGTVEDSHGGPLAGASVKLTNLSTHDAHTANTDGSGAFIVDGLPPGEYQATVSARGLLSKTEKVHLKPGSRAKLHVRLKLPKGMPPPK
ncbi:MAG TPA: carboxypeptidase-like regulatory domain-containing protein [Candidatus Acidoferrales bacterium]